MKKMLSLFFVTILLFTLAACGGNTKPVNKTGLDNSAKQVRTTLVDVEVVDQTSLNILDLEIGKYFISKADHDSAMSLLTKADELLADSKAKAQDVDKLISDLNTLFISLYSQIVMGLKVSEATADLNGVQSQIAALKDLLFGVVVGTKAEDVFRGTKFSSKEVLDQVRAALSEAEALIEGNFNDEGVWEYKNATPTEEQFQNAIQSLKTAQIQLAESIQRGTKDPNITVVYRDDYQVNLETLNLGGKVIPYFTHVESEDNPFITGFSSNVIDRLDYERFLKDLQTKYNFTFDFQTYKDYNTIAADMSVYLRGTPNAAIMRIPETKIFMDNIKSGNLHPFTSVIGSLRSQYQEEYIVNQWQIDRGTIGGKVFGIQRNDGVTYPDLMMFNRTLLKEVLGQDTKMPDEMWADNEWTFDNFKTLVNQLSGALDTKPGVRALGITPYFMGINAVNADGVELVDSTQPTVAQQLRINKTEVINILNQYTTEFFDGQSGKSIWYNSGNTSYTKEYLDTKSVNKNHLYDMFQAGNLGIATFQNWQASLLSEVPFEASVVPFPQFNRQQNDRYISPIESGDILAVTRGDNHFEVATILMLINKYMKGVQTKMYEQEKIDLGLPENTRIEDVMAAVFVKDKTKNVQEADILRAREIAAFIHGYHKDYDNARLSDLPSLAADDMYAFAIQQRLHIGGGFANHIGAQMDKISSEYQKVLELLKRFE